MATPARCALRCAKSTIRCARSLPKMVGRCTGGGSCCARSASWRIASQTWAWNGSIFSNAKRRRLPGAIWQAICAASIAIVPLPQQGSYSGTDGSCAQPQDAIIAAASVSFSGASPLSSRQPRLNSASPEVSMYSDTVSVVRCA
jgi:hypothetical protein